jgi:hypothetical protein
MNIAIWSASPTAPFNQLLQQSGNKKQNMKKLIQILPFILLSLMAQAQQTEDDIYVGKSRTFGNYRGTDIRTSNQVKGQLIITGTVLKVDVCEVGCLTVWVKKNDGSTVSVGTKDHGFSIPKNTIGKRIIVEGIDSAKYNADKKTVKSYQKDIQVIATGIRIFY